MNFLLLLWKTHKRLNLSSRPFLNVQFGSVTCIHIVCNRSLELFHLATLKLPLPPSFGNHLSTFCCCDLTTLVPSYEWNHELVTFWALA